ncbi:hypothetical protein BJX96DRAFT_151107, partial [Aspergillus floccosus]
MTHLFFTTLSSQSPLKPPMLPTMPKRKRDNNSGRRRDIWTHPGEGEEETLYINSNRKKLKVYKSDKKSRQSVESRPEEDTPAPAETPVDAPPRSDSEETDVPSPKPPQKSKETSSSSPKPERKASVPATLDAEASNPFLAQKGKRKRPDSNSDTSKKDNRTGFFTSDEVKALEKFKIDFCNTHGLPGSTFDAMVQHSAREKGETFPGQDVISKQDFWKEIYGVHPKRDRRSVYRFMRRHFQASQQKPHEWTKLQDQELIELHEKYGPRWAYIAKIIGRSDDDVVQRWKNRLEHRHTMKSGPWSEEEVCQLLEAVQDSWTKLKQQGINVGKDYYEMDEKLVSWGHVSRALGHCRSRQQCADKWRKARRKILTQRARGQPDAVYDPALETRLASRRSRSLAAASRSASPDRNYKSSKYVEESDEDEAEQDDKTNGERTSAKSKAPTPKTPKTKHSEAPEIDETPQEREKSSSKVAAPKTHEGETIKTDSDDSSSDESEDSSSSDSDSDSSRESESSDDEDEKPPKRQQNMKRAKVTQLPKLKKAL